MLIDWFTVAAQIVNFLVLVWLLKRFLYAPILKALDAREKRIASELADAAEKQAQALAEREEYKNKIEELERQKAELLRNAAADAAALREKLMMEARSETEALREKHQKQLNDEYRSLTREIARRTQASVFAIAKKALADLAGADLEERITYVFVRRLKEMDARSGFPDRLIVKSAFELQPSLRASIEEAIRKFSGAEIVYEQDSGLFSGIELVAGGQKIAWSMGDYLGMLEQEVSALIRAGNGEKK